MKLFISLFMVIALTITACAQQQKKTEEMIPKEQTKPAVVQKIKMTVNDMVCSACQSAVKKAIKSLNGVTNVEVSLENKMAFISYDPLKVKPEQIQRAVNNKGYTAGKPQEVKQ